MSNTKHPHFTADLKFSPFWWDAAPRITRGSHELPTKADVVIIGSGFTGLSAAITTAKAGNSVVVLDSGEVGGGASTRNGGQVGSGNQKFPVKKLRAIYGQHKASQLLNEGSAMLQYIADLIEHEKIDCAFTHCGRFRGAIQPSHYDRMARDLEDLHDEIGVEFEMIPQNEQHREIGSDFYYGGSLLPNDASVHPGLYHAGLVECAQKYGAKILSHSGVIGIDSDNSQHTIETTRGRISASIVIVATNGYTSHPFKYIKKRIVPIKSAVIATAELSEDIIKSIVPNKRVYGNTARVFHYFRPSPDGKRIIWGGRDNRMSLEHTPASVEHLRKDMVRVFPQLSDVEISHGWTGQIGYTFDEIPHLGCINGIHYALGYCGTGVSRSTYFGNKIALKALGMPGHETSFDDLPLPSHPFHWGTSIGVPLVESYYRALDKFVP